MWYDKAGLWFSISIIGGVLLVCGVAWYTLPGPETVKTPCVCKAETCPTVSACPDPPKLPECPLLPPATTCPEVVCTEQVVMFGDYFAEMTQQAENQLQLLKAEFEAKKAELDPIFAHAKELNIGPRQAWVGNPEAVRVYLTTISRIGELENIWSRMLRIIESVQGRMDHAWYENADRRKLWAVLPNSVESYRDQLQAFTGQANNQWFTYLCAWEIEKRDRETAQ